MDVMGHFKVIGEHCRVFVNTEPDRQGTRNKETLQSQEKGDTH